MGHDQNNWELPMSPASQWERADNLERAIEHYRLALECIRGRPSSTSGLPPRTTWDAYVARIAGGGRTTWSRPRAPAQALK